MGRQVGKSPLKHTKLTHPGFARLTRVPKRQTNAHADLAARDICRKWSHYELNDGRCAPVIVEISFFPVSSHARDAIYPPRSLARSPTHSLTVARRAESLLMHRRSSSSRVADVIDYVIAADVGYFSISTAVIGHRRAGIILTTDGWIETR